MRSSLPTQAPQSRSHRPRALTVFAAAFVAGAAAAVGVNRTLDVRLAQSKPRVESEAIFVALRSLPQGSPVTVWDVALRDWPKAMLPATALRASDNFSGHVLKHPLREGQPLLSIQLTPSGQGTQPTTEPTPFPPPAAYTQSSVPSSDADLWSTPVAIPPKQVAGPTNAAQQQPVTVSETVTKQETVTQTETVTPTEAVTVSEPVAVQETVLPSEPVAMPQAASVAVASDHSIPDSNAITDSNAILNSNAITDSNAIPDNTINGIPAATPETVTAPENVATTATAVVEPTLEPTTVPESQAPTPALSDVSAGMQTPTLADPTEVAPPVVNPETAAPEMASVIAPLPIASSPPAPADRPRPAQTRFLVVPERIAIQADASFTARAAVQPSETTARPTTGRPAERPTSNAVQPLPSTATAERRPQGRPTENSPQGRQPQRQGRQATPATTGAAPEVPPQPRFGMTMFPNVSAGIEALENRMRGDQPGQGTSPTASQARPVTAR